MVAAAGGGRRAADAVMQPRPACCPCPPLMKPSPLQQTFQTSLNLS